MKIPHRYFKSTFTSLITNRESTEKQKKNGSPEPSQSKAIHILMLSILSDQQSVHVVLADDDEDDRLMLEEAVHDVHPKIRFETVENGDALMKLLLTSNSSLPDLILLDLNMPGKNGRVCLDEIRSSERLKNLPVVIYSTSANPKDIEETFDKGANLYIQKPNSYQELTALTKKLFSLNLNEYLPNGSLLKFVLSAK